MAKRKVMIGGVPIPVNAFTLMEDIPPAAWKEPITVSAPVDGMPGEVRLEVYPIVREYQKAWEEPIELHLLVPCWHSYRCEEQLLVLRDGQVRAILRALQSVVRHAMKQGLPV